MLIMCNKSSNTTYASLKQKVLFVILQTILVLVFIIILYQALPAFKSNTQTASGSVENIEYVSYIPGKGLGTRYRLALYVNGDCFQIHNVFEFSNDATYSEILDRIKIGDEVEIRYIERFFFGRQDKFVVELQDNEGVYRTVETHNKSQAFTLFSLAIMFIICELPLIGVFYLVEFIQLVNNTKYLLKRNKMKRK